MFPLMNYSYITNVKKKYIGLRLRERAKQFHDKNCQDQRVCTSPKALESWLLHILLTIFFLQFRYFILSVMPGSDSVTKEIYDAEERIILGYPYFNCIYTIYIQFISYCRTIFLMRKIKYVATLSCNRSLWHEVRKWAYITWFPGYLPSAL